MKLITKIEIKGFRSIRNAELSGVEDFTAFAGLNNSGKSNFLRALNAFFNGYTDPNKELDVDEDYFRPDLKFKKAKRIRVSVTFSLPDGFRFRRGLESVEALLFERRFTIAKEWRRKEPLPTYFLNDEKLDLENRQRIDQFLQLVNFRYIPNRVLPTEVIRGEHRNLRDVLVRRLGRRALGQEETFAALRDTSQNMIRELVKRLKEATPDIGDVRLATPASWVDMIFTFGYRLGRDDVEIDDVSQGSGIQSLLMLETLYLIDRDYFQKFGWRQAAVWAVEEPESSLHASLEARVASYLSSIASDPTSRLQVLCTTHSDLMIQYADKAVVVEKNGWETVCNPESNPRAAMEIVSRTGISRWVHPILYHPLDLLILVEGKFDAAFLEEAFKLIRPTQKVEVSYLEKLEDGGGTGGVDEVFRYVKSNVAAIKSRRPEAPVIVVLDWDAANRADRFRRLFTEIDPAKVLVWPETAFNPILGNSFKGIERHFSDRIIQEGETRGVTVFRSPAGVCSIERDNYGQAKQTFHEIVKQGLQVTDLAYARAFVEEILRTAGAI